MTQPTLTTIRSTLASYITTNTGLRATANRQAQLAPPMAIILPVTGTFATYSVTFDQETNYSLRAVVAVSRADSSDGQDLMDAYVSTTGAKSVYAALQKDPTLGGVVSYAVLREATGYGTISHGGIDYLGCSLIIDVAI